MRLFLINENKLLPSGSVFIFLNEIHVEVSLIFNNKTQVVLPFQSLPIPTQVVCI